MDMIGSDRRLLLEEKLSPKVTDEVYHVFILLRRPPHPTSLPLGHLPLKGKAFVVGSRGIRILPLRNKEKTRGLRVFSMCTVVEKTVYIN